MTLPKPKNLQSRLLLQKMCNRLALAPVRVCRSLHSCVFCGCPIVNGDSYRDKGYAARAHDICFHAVARDIGGAAASVGLVTAKVERP